MTRRNPRSCAARLVARPAAVLVAGVLALATVPGGFPQPRPDEPAGECRWADMPVAIDGRGNEPAWKDARPINRPERAKLLWDREFLYFFAEHPLAPGSLAVRPAGGR